MEDYWDQLHTNGFYYGNGRTQPEENNGFKGIEKFFSTVKSVFTEGSNNLRHRTKSNSMMPTSPPFKRPDVQIGKPNKDTLFEEYRIDIKDETPSPSSQPNKPTVLKMKEIPVKEEEEEEISLISKKQNSSPPSQPKSRTYPFADDGEKVIKSELTLIEQEIIESIKYAVF